MILIHLWVDSAARLCSWKSTIHDSVKFCLTAILDRIFFIREREQGAVGRISFLPFGWCVTGRAFLTLALEAENQGEPVPNAPYAIDCDNAIVFLKPFYPTNPITITNPN